MGKITIYSDCTVCKLNNRRIVVGKEPNESLEILLYELHEKGTAQSPLAHTEWKHERVSETRITISIEAAEALMYVLQQELKRIGNIS